MFSRFVTVQGATLFIKTEHIIGIKDTEDETCIVMWWHGDGERNQRIAGTAQENFDRLKAEELDLIAAAAERQQRADRGLPLLPVPRGRAK